MDKIYEKLNHADRAQRLKGLQEAVKSNRPAQIYPQYVNNHVHTCYSFSPYSPAAAVYAARMAGLLTVGIMDHDSIAGAREFVEAGKIADMAVTVGIECRASMAGTFLEGKRINNPDQETVAYIALHGIPHTQFDTIDAFFKPLRERRNARSVKMLQNINDVVLSSGIALDFERDVLPLSKYSEGGSVTERHLLYALTQALLKRVGRGESVVDFVHDTLGLKLSEAQKSQLLDAQNPYYEYDLLGLFKGEFIERIFIPATDECPSIQEVSALAAQTGAILCYPYLGDITASVTGDKKAQTFEDSFLEPLFETLASLGINAITYMPSRNTLEQLKRLKALCERYGMFEISGEDINTPRQKFICLALDLPAFSNLIDSTWALIGHEKASTRNLDDAMFSKKSVAAYPDLKERVRAFMKIGKEA